MKTVFNILVAALVLWILWACVFGGRKPAAQDIEVAHVEGRLDGINSMKICKNYFSRPYSVAYSDMDDVLYISCLNDVSSEASYPGYVCKVNLFGEIIDTLSIPELREPKGLAVVDSHLYITDLNRVVRYNIETDSVDHVYLIPKALYLADIVSNRLGEIYISDSHASMLYKISGDSSVVFCRDTLCHNIAGLCMDGDDIVAGVKNAVLRIGPNGKVKVVSNTNYSTCGIKSIDNGVYLASDFVGNIHYIKNGKSSVSVKKTSDVNSADFEYVAAQRMIYMPTYIDNSLSILQVGDNL